ncbi:hypothetical protein [Vibrio genomosp. F10]|uniref:hypothetical protein n=1 Tax=Vibrio genomosp. F10 TaxID=723171 RepID=UPI0002E193E1|nr:hypothetical protein [Vibrio genomosp. F10]OEF03192.1 hypothetical protein A1QK_00160 [Vibrio genomosp. F10 str. 9ZD137]
MVPLSWLLCSVAIMVSTHAVSSDLSLDWDWQLSLNQTAHRETVLLGQPKRSDTGTLDALIDVQASWKDLTGLFALKGNALWSNDDTRSLDTDVIVQELFWQGSTEAWEQSVDLTLGKVRLDWGVGYGYRPLDIFKPYRRNPIGIQVEEGAGTAMASYFDMSGEWSLVYTDSSWTQQQGSELEKQSQQQGFGLRRYALLGDSEWQGIAYYDDVRHGLVGGSFVTVVDPAWALHVSAVYQRQYLAYQQGEPFQAVSLSTQHHGYQSLIGMNWASSTGHNIIMEYWFDSRSWSRDEWQQAFERGTDLASNPHTLPLASSYAQGFNHANLVQHNMMFHWSLNSASWSHWAWSNNWLWLNDFEPTFDVIVSPQDGGLIATQWLNYQMYDSGYTSFNVELAARFLGGSSDSVYANLPDKHMILLNLKGKF